jgi:hypothetical protein
MILLATLLLQGANGQRLQHWQQRFYEEKMENELKEQTVTKDTELKSWLVEYVGEQLAPENEEITVDMIVEVVAKEFPEFLMVVAEENYFRGYKQALDDAEHGMQVIHEQELGQVASRSS